MTTSNNTRTVQQDPDDTAASLQARPDITRRYDTIAGELLGTAERSAGWLHEQVRSGFEDFASRVFYGEPATPQSELDREPARDEGRDR